MIILLNVLIAIVSDSYEKATLRGQVLFGKARVMFVAQNEALESFLKPRRQKTVLELVAWTRAKVFGRWLMLTVILLTAMFTETWLVSAVVSLLVFHKGTDLVYCIVGKYSVGRSVLVAVNGMVVVGFCQPAFFFFFYSLDNNVCCNSPAPCRTTGRSLVGRCNVSIGRFFPMAPPRPNRVHVLCGWAFQSLLGQDNLMFFIRFGTREGGDSVRT